MAIISTTSIGKIASNEYDFLSEIVEAKYVYGNSLSLVRLKISPILI